MSDITSVLDWGPGSCWTSEMISDGRDVHLVDVSQDVLDVAAAVIPAATTYLIDSTSTFKDVSDVLGSTRIDLLTVFSVIYHFPSLEYFHAMASLWRRISPSYIIIKTMIAHDETWERASYEEYENSNGYIRGLLLSEREIKKTLKDYDLIFSHDDEVVPGLFGSINKMKEIEVVPDHRSKLYVFKKIDI